MAWSSVGVKPLTIRPITVAGRAPVRNPSIAAVSSAALRPAIGGRELPGPWQPEHPDAPIGGTAAAAGRAAPARNASGRKDARQGQAADRSWFFSGRVRMRLPVAANSAFSTAGEATAIVGSPTPPQNPPEAAIWVSTFGMSSMRSTS